MTDPILASIPSTTTALAIGRIASRALAADASGRVLAVFSRGCYLQAANGGLACVGPASLGRGPLNVIVNDPERLEGLRRGDEWRRCDSQVVINGRSAFALPAIERWRPPRVAGRPPPSVALAALTTFVSRRAPTSGLGLMIAPLLTGDAFVAGASALSRVAAGPLVAVREWVSSDAAEAPPADAVGLLGMGPGLTPSGDDALCGALLALRAYGRVHAARDLADLLSAASIAATGTISRAHLACAIDGEGHESLHALLAALASADGRAIVAAAERATAIGHSSGWDALAGMAAVLAGLSRIVDQRQRQRRRVGV